MISNDNEEKLFRGNEEASDNANKGSNTIKDPDNWTTGDEKMLFQQLCIICAIYSMACNFKIIVTYSDPYFATSKTLKVPAIRFGR